MVQRGLALFARLTARYSCVLVLLKIFICSTAMALVAAPKGTRVAPAVVLVPTHTVTSLDVISSDWIVL